MRLRIGTSESGGTFDTQGRAIGDCFSGQEDVSAIDIVHAPNASIDNANRLDAGDIDFGFMASNWIGLARQGSSPFSRPIALRMVSPANAGPLFFIALAESGITTIDDLVGKRVSIGPAHSGMTQHVHTMFGVLGIPLDAFTPVHLNFEEGADALVAGDVDAQFQCPIPNAVMTALSERADVRVLEFGPGQLDRLIADVPYYRKTTMRGGAFRGLATDSEQVAVLNVVVTHERMDDAVVAAFVRSMVMNVDALAAANPLFRGLGDLYEPLRVEGPAALEFGGVPLHPGAVAAYRQAGLLG